MQWRLSILVTLFAVMQSPQIGLGDNANKPAAKSKKPPAFLVSPYLQLPTTNAMTIMWETNAKLPSVVEYGATRELGSRVENKGDTSLHEVRITGLETGKVYHYRVRSGSLVSAINTFRTAPVEGTKRWRMAVYGDSRSSPGTHRKVVQQIARAKVDLIVHTGDIVLNGKVHSTWRKEFFQPLAAIAGAVPWVSTIGNHERDSENYFSYMALPGNKRFFSFPYANADIICLDSNGWIAKGRDSKQYQWLLEHLQKKRAKTWTFVAFHHPLFSAHATRGINSLRWDWAPLFLERKHQVDVVLAGHDHFYSRNFRLGRLADKPQAGVLFLTTAGGGAGLYRCKLRDTIAFTKSVHHFTLFDFNGDTAIVSAIDITGKVIDRYELTKKPTQAEDFCAYDVEEFRKFLRLALAKHQPAALANGNKPTIVDSVLKVPTRFQVPVSGTLHWQKLAGWKFKRQSQRIHLKPSQALEIPLRVTVEKAAIHRSPELVIEFDKGRFRNRITKVHPIKLAGPVAIKLKEMARPVLLNANQANRIWHGVLPYSLLPLAMDAPRSNEVSDQVQFSADKEQLHVRAILSDVQGAVEVATPEPKVEGSRLIYFGEHFRVLAGDDKSTFVFAISPQGVRYATRDGKIISNKDWQAVVAKGRGAWIVHVSIPRKLLPPLIQLRVNAVHNRRVTEKPSPRRYAEYELCPTYKLGNDPDLIPDWRASASLASGARLTVESEK